MTAEWKHNPSGEDIVSQVRKAPLAIKRQAALVLLRNGANPRQIRKKLDISDRQLRVVESLWRAAVKAGQSE
jgi:hypothetical protein